MLRDMYLLNAIPGAVIPSTGCTLRIEPLDDDEVDYLVEDIEDNLIIPAIRHKNMATILSGELGVEIPVARLDIPVLEPGDQHFLALYYGPRIPERMLEMPEDGHIEFFRMRVEEPYTGQWLTPLW